MKKFIKNPWILGIGTTVVGGVLLSFVMDWINKVDWLSTLKTVLKFIGNAIVAFLNFESINEQIPKGNQKDRDISSLWW